MKTKSPLTKTIILIGLTAMLSTQNVHASCSERFMKTDPQSFLVHSEDITNVASYTTYYSMYLAQFLSVGLTPIISGLITLGSWDSNRQKEANLHRAVALGTIHDLLRDRDVSDETKKEIQELENKGSKMSTISALVAPYRASILKRMKAVRSDFDGEILVDRSDGKEVLYNITKNGAPFGRDASGTPKQKNGLPMLKIYSGPKPKTCEYSAEFEKMSDLELAKRIADFDNGEAACVEGIDEKGVVEYNTKVTDLDLLATLLCESPADKAAATQSEIQVAPAASSSSNAPKVSASSLN